MTRSTLAVTLLAMHFFLPGALWARVSLVKNGSMEAGEGAGAIDPQVADEWTEFGINVERSDTVNMIPEGSGHALKAFGDGTSSTSGAFQEVADISPDQNVTVSVHLYTPDFDKLGGSGQAGLVVEFLDFFGSTLASEELYVLDDSSPANTWIPAVIGPTAAPSSTTKIRVTCKLQWVPGDVFGAAYWDDVQVAADGSENLVVNGDFETAGTSTGQSSVGIDDWVGFGDQEKSDDVALDGSASLKLGSNEPFSGLFQSLGVLNEGDHIFMQAYVWNPSEDPLTDSSLAGIKLEFDANADVPPAEENLPFNEDSPQDEWTLVELNTVVPDDVTVARIVCIYTGDASTSGEVHFDSMFAERDSFPGTNQLLNSSFEAGPGGPNGLTDWTEFNTTGVSQAQKSCFSVPADDGVCTMKATGQEVAGIFQEITVSPGEGLSISGYLYSPASGPLTGPGLAGLKVEWAVGGVPGDIDIGGSDNTIDASAPVDTWIPIFIDYTMPEGSSALGRFTNIIARDTAPSGTVYFDSCEAVVLNRFDGADGDNDGDEDLRDFGAFQRCFTGSDADMLPFNCIVFDSDDDGNVDLTDYGFFADHVTGPN